MLLDIKGNLWAISFSGARTSGFISLELIGIKEGDLIGLNIIYNYL
jgi:hypothetical protein